MKEGKEGGGGGYVESDGWEWGMLKERRKSLWERMMCI